MAQLLKMHPTHPQGRLVRRAADIIRSGGIIAYPTDASYALGCRVGDADAARRVRQLRDVDVRHHLTLVCRDLAEVGRFARLDNTQFDIVKHANPGEFTFLLRASSEVPRRLQHPKRNTVGIRIPRHAVVRALLAELGEPMLSSTLILPGDDEPLHEADEVVARVGSRVDAIIDAGTCKTMPTTVVDLEASPPVVVRAGLGDPRALGLETAPS